MKLKIAALGLLLVLAPVYSNAALVININEIGPNVRFAANGMLDLTNLGAATSASGTTQAFVDNGAQKIESYNGTYDFYSDVFTSPQIDFFGNPSIASTFNLFGDSFGFSVANNRIVVPQSYVTNSAILGYFDIGNVTLNELKLISGTYVYTLENLDTITVNVSAVPLPAALPLFGAGLALMGLLGWRRRRRQAVAAA